MVQGSKTRMVLHFNPEEGETRITWQRSTTIRVGLAKQGAIGGHRGTDLTGIASFVQAAPTALQAKGKV
jgi:hypothetical protein